MTRPESWSLRGPQSEVGLRRVRTIKGSFSETKKTKQKQILKRKELWESWGGKVSPLHVTFSSKSENTTQNPPPTRRPDTGTRGGAVPRKVCCEGAPLSRLSSGQFSSGEGARQAGLSALFPAPSWVALSPTPPPIHLQGAPRGTHGLSNASLSLRGPGPSCYTLPPRLLPYAGSFPTCSCRNSGCRWGLLPRGLSSLKTTCRTAGPSRN